jgi:ribulose-5-phosphate 4-epimerase/fuculose-1-phosphate aldolase
MVNQRQAEGYIKFQCTREVAEPNIDAAWLDELNRCRSELMHLRMIGIYPSGVGFGNISFRITGEDEFMISGSATGALSLLDGSTIARVTRCDISQNKVWCRGFIDASSESMSHAAVYRHHASIGAVVHIHHAQLWERLLDKLPATSKAVPYGTPAMSGEIARLLVQYQLQERGLLVMGGHEEGLIAFAPTLGEATQLFTDIYYRQNLMTQQP